MTRIVSICVFLACFSLMVGCDGGTSVSGVIVDAAGTPLPDADVSFSRNKGKIVKRDKSSLKGTFEVAMTHAPTPMTLTLKVEKNGYAPVEIPIEAGGSQEIPKIVLKRVAVAPRGK